MAEKVTFSDSFTTYIQGEARAMALAVNGGDWGTDYTEAQKVGWAQKAVWAARRYGGYDAHC